MCGRKTLTKTIEKIVEDLYIDEWRMDNYIPSYNIAPSQFSPILINKNNSKVVKRMRWGITPTSSRNMSLSSNIINARYETIGTKASFRGLIKNNRCIVVADGYFEWEKSQEKRSPYYLRNSNKKIMALAGLWTSIESEHGKVDSYVIVTTQASKHIEHIHNRMPLIIDDDKIDIWLDINDNNDEKLMDLKSNRSLSYYPVSSFVNHSKNNSKKCIQPLHKEETLNLFQ